MSKGSITLALVMAGRPFGDIVDKELNNWQKMETGIFFFFKAGKFQGKESFAFMSLVQTLKNYRSKCSDIQSL